MHKRNASPIALFVVGIALIIVGMTNDNTAIWIVGIVFIVLGLGARKRFSEKKIEKEE